MSSALPVGDANLALPNNSLAMSSALPVGDANLELPTNSLAMSSALPVANTNFSLPTNSLGMSSPFPVAHLDWSLPSNLLAMSSTFLVANANLMNLWLGDKVVAPLPSEPSIVENWQLSSSSINNVLGYNHSYIQQYQAAREDHYSPVVEAIACQGGEDILDDPFYCWTY
ncbi:hypothetical protein MKX01_002447 [Papaver californicum]|nr:hypothetical protein MKX01_002447 [Papaver californicum]